MRINLKKFSSTTGSFLAAILVTYCAINASANASCGDPRIAKPAWVSQLESVDNEYYYAAGVADRKAELEEQRIAVAKQNALKALAEMIQVTVKNDLQQVQSVISKTGASTLSESSVNSVTESSTSASLQNAEVVATWVDTETCATWLRVRVPKKLVEKKQREIESKQFYDLFQEQMAIAQDTKNPASKRGQAISACLTLIDRIDFTLLPGAGSSAYIRQQLTKLGSSINAASSDVDNAHEALRKVDDALQLAVTATESQKSKHFAEATRLIKLLLARHPDGLLQVFSANELRFRLAEVNEMSGNICSARLGYMRVYETDTKMEEAKRRSANLTCNAADMEKESWRAYFDGRTVQLGCYLVKGKAVTPWRKICDSVGAYLGGMGISVKVNESTPRADNLHRLLTTAGAGVESSDTDTPLYFLAEGQISRRRDIERNGPSGFEYQFNGVVGIQSYERGKPVFSDRFEGVTGWNPISEKMVEDVLALNIFKRWKEKFGLFITSK